jgi:hypothetical protein
MNSGSERSCLISAQLAALVIIIFLLLTKECSVSVNLKFDVENKSYLMS